ncbi:hypothetical protein [Methylobacterium planeticum]|uniref:Uncharacterized protein n=1 Tax=Methylobacterium planeticum TaxID=2615211 RepID=A0A6N6MG06_9HYPH|nr:hypothetical protein [Methylobacterium planeticum]KAB1068753.1 hypothetical protein F6X51_26450 [Methylobacterium planeticum]
MDDAVGCKRQCDILQDAKDEWMARAERAEEHARGLSMDLFEAARERDDALALLAREHTDLDRQSLSWSLKVLENLSDADPLDAQLAAEHACVVLRQMVRI